MPVRPKADEFDEDLTQPILQGSVSTADESALSSLLLDMIGDTSKLAVMVGDLDASEFRAVASRLKAFVDLVARIPREPSIGKIVGFKVKPPLMRKIKRDR